MTDVKTLERIVPDQVSSGGATGSETLKLHLERYDFAVGHLPAARLLDLACGVGYGTALLSSKLPGSRVTGVDLSPDAITYAREHYGSPDVEFVLSDAMTFASQPFDAIVSLETIEHLPDPHAFIRRCVSTLLKTGGTFVGSVPVTPSVDANPHHITDFTPKSFRGLLRDAGLKEITCLDQVQPFNPVAIAKRVEPRMSGMRQNLPRYYLTHPGKALLRMRSILLDGFNNKYLTIVARKP